MIHVTYCWSQAWRISITLLACAAAAAAKLFQSCLILCDPIDGSPPGSPVPGILQARTVEWVAISFSSAWKWKVKVKSLSHVRLFATPWTAVYQAPLSMGFSRQEYWSGCHCLLQWGWESTSFIREQGWGGPAQQNQSSIFSPDGKPLKLGLWFAYHEYHTGEKQNPIDVMARTTRQKINKDIEDLKSTINH